MEENRPNPDLLIQQINQETEGSNTEKKKGKLKIFLGYAPGVGKTYRMLQEAGLNKKNNIDVVIGIAETHGRKETELLLTSLEIIQQKKIKYSGIILEEMDIDTLLARQPTLVIVDELAHTNAPGSRHDKRYQDTEELLTAGINVFTTLNIQHIESLNDIIQQISGIKVSERVPDRIIELADEVELVDLTPEKLLERLREGKVYIPPRAEQAMRQFFRKGNLLALRELSLKYTAKQVDEDIRTFMEKNVIPGVFTVNTKILLGISASPTTENLLRFTQRMADDLDVEWFAVYVESPQKVEKYGKVQLEKNFHLAENLGAKIVLLSGRSVADELLNFAKSKNVTLIIVGPSKRNFFEKLFKGSVIEELINRSGPINVLVAGKGGFKKPIYEKYYVPNKRDYKSFLFSFILILVITGIGLSLRSFIEPVNIGLLLLLPSIASGILWGIRVGLFASIISVCAFDFFFIPPYNTFEVSDVKYLPSFVVFILVSVTISFLVKSLRKETESYRNRERFIYSLYSFSREIIAAKDLNNILNRAVKYIAEAFESNAIIFLPDDSKNLIEKSKNDDSLTITETEHAIVSWVYNNGQPAGKGTNTLSSSNWYCLPLKVRDNTIGVIALKMNEQDKTLTLDQIQLFESFSSIVAFAIQTYVLTAPLKL